jgi:tRNA (guanine6-N2)-methyltransferase
MGEPERRRARAPARRQPGGDDVWEVECDVLPGLEAFLARELRRCFRGRVGQITDSGRASLRFAFAGSPADLLRLRTAQAAYLALSFSGRRPGALLAHQSLRELLRRIELVRSLHPPGTFESFRFGAAGRDTSMFRRLAAELETQAGLRHDPDDGELLIRVRLSDRADDGWEALVRISPRPLANRPWRVANYPGALNAAIAAVMVDLTQPRPEDHFINLMCGSGTLLAERLTLCPVAEAVGCDISREALDAARANLRVPLLRGSVRLMESDATLTGLDMARYTAICADLPDASQVSEQRPNVELVPALLDEAARLAAPGARFVALTHDLRLFDDGLRGADRRWQPERTVRVFQGGQRPMIYVLKRTAAR